MIWSRILIALLFVVCTACGSEEEAGGQEDNWWDSDTTDTSDATGTDATGSDDATADTGDKPADSGDKPESEDDGDKNSLLGEVDTSTGTGTLSYINTQSSGEDCALSYPILSASAQDTCDACSSAWALEIGEVNITNDAGGCGDFGTFSNTTRYYGESSTLLTEYGGVTYYELYESDDGVNWVNSGGYAWTTGSVWSFGSK